MRIHGKGGRIRTLLLDEAQLVNLLRRFLRQTGYTHGPLFRAVKNWTGRPLGYSAAQALAAHTSGRISNHSVATSRSSVTGEICSGGAHRSPS
ncbi:hypothetical protein GCM10009789_43510 [Kribbella sancticallisti]|uniref:Uncharacterized protein n=1 Tax=Kribbella sancticallisti TaxID=460087 RepID=A0ABN2DS85_9ACTN